MQCSADEVFGRASEETHAGTAIAEVGRAIGADQTVTDNIPADAARHVAGDVNAIAGEIHNGEASQLILRGTHYDAVVAGEIQSASVQGNGAPAVDTCASRAVGQKWQRRRNTDSPGDGKIDVVPARRVVGTEHRLTQADFPIRAGVGEERSHRGGVAICLVGECVYRYCVHLGENCRNRLARVHDNGDGGVIRVSGAVIAFPVVKDRAALVDGRHQRFRAWQVGMRSRRRVGSAPADNGYLKCRCLGNPGHQPQKSTRCPPRLLFHRSSPLPFLAVQCRVWSVTSHEHPTAVSLEFRRISRLLRRDSFVPAPVRPPLRRKRPVLP